MSDPFIRLIVTVGVFFVGIVAWEAAGFAGTMIALQAVLIGLVAVPLKGSP